MADVAAILEDLGLPSIRVRGDEVWASCPAHHDSGDSWSMNARTGLSSCFACGYRAPLPELVMDLRGGSLWDAMRYIRSFGVSLPAPAELEYFRDEVPRHEASTTFVPDIAIVRYGPPPPAELARRHLSAEAADCWGIRWNRDTDAWILPIRNPAGQLLGWQEKGPAGVRNRPPKVPKSHTVYGAERLRVTPRLVLVESPLDAVYLDTLGIPAVASFGAGVSEHQMRLVADYAQSLTIALDNDMAGVANTERLVRQWVGRLPLFTASYWTPPGTKPKDPGDMTPEQVERALTPTHALDWLGANGVQGLSPPFSDRGRRGHGRQAQRLTRLPNGARQDRVHHRRGRTAH